MNKILTIIACTFMEGKQEELLWAAAAHGLLPGMQALLCSLLPLHWLGWRSCATCRGGHGWLCSVFPGALLFWMCPASSLLLPPLPLACIPRSATGIGIQKAFQGAEPTLRVVASWRPIPCFSYWDKMG